MSDRFAICLPRVLASEGGWSDNPADPGGATMKGVTLAVFSRFKGRSCTKDELRHISDADLAAIYRQGYWTAAHCDELQPGIDYVVFDCAVNSGPGRAIKTLQAAVNVTPDGAFGPRTKAAIMATGQANTIREFSAQREAFYRSLGTFPTFGRGWLSRLHSVTETALADMLVIG
jgi:lysozyme family protein